MVDYLVSRNRRDIEVSSCPSSTSSISKSSLGTCLDLGCGTGVVGLASLLLGADKCVFSDKSITPWYSHFCSLNYFSLLFNLLSFDAALDALEVAGLHDSGSRV